MVPAEDEDSVEFTLSEADFIAAATLPSFAAATGDRRRVLIPAAAAIVGMLAVAAMFYLIFPGIGWVAAPAVYLMLVLVARMPLRRLRVSRARRAFRDPRYAAVRRRQRVRLSPAGILIAGGVGESVTDWFSVRGILRLPQGLAFYLAHGTASFVPNGAFAESAAGERFENTARRLHAQAAAAGSPVAIPSEAGETGALAFTLSVDDLAAFHYFAHRRSFARRHQRFIGFCVAVPALLGVVLAFNRTSLGWPDAEESLVLALLALFIAGLAVALWYGDPWLDRRLCRAIARGRGDDLGPVQMAMTPEGLLVTNRVGRHRVAWPSLTAIETGPDGAYLFTTPQQAHIIPRRAFASGAAFQEFVGAMNQRRSRIAKAGAVDPG